MPYKQQQVFQCITWLQNTSLKAILYVMLWGVKELFKQFLYSFSGLFPLAFHSNLFALKCLCYSIVAIHPELLHRNYFSYSETVPDKITRPGPPPVAGGGQGHILTFIISFIHMMQAREHGIEGCSMKIILQNLPLPEGATNHFLNSLNGLRTHLLQDRTVFILTFLLGKKFSRPRLSS